MKLRRVVHRKVGEGTGWGRARVVRGNGWYSSASDLRAADRSNDSPSYQNPLIGARLSRRIKTKKRQR